MLKKSAYQHLLTINFAPSSLAVKAIASSLNWALRENSFDNPGTPFDLTLAVADGAWPSSNGVLDATRNYWGPSQTTLEQVRSRVNDRVSDMTLLGIDVVPFLLQPPSNCSPSVPLPKTPLLSAKNISDFANICPTPAAQSPLFYSSAPFAFRVLPVHRIIFEDSPSTANSSSGLIINNSGTLGLQGNMTLARVVDSGCVVGSCALFNATNATMGLANLSRISFPPASHIPTPFSIAFWAFPTGNNQSASPTEGSILSTSSLTAKRFIVDPDGNLTAGNTLGVAVTTAGISVYCMLSQTSPPILRAVLVSPINISAWTHITIVVISSTAVQLYVNGTLLRQVNPNFLTMIFYIKTLGASQYGGYYGLLDDFAVFRTALSADEVSLWYQFSSTNSQPQTGIVAGPKMLDPETGGFMQRFEIPFKPMTQALVIPTWASISPCGTVEVKLWGASGELDFAVM